MYAEKPGMGVGLETNGEITRNSPFSDFQVLSSGNILANLWSNIHTRSLMREQVSDTLGSDHCN